VGSWINGSLRVVKSRQRSHRIIALLSKWRCTIFHCRFELTQTAVMRTFPAPLKPVNYRHISVVADLFLGIGRWNCDRASALPR
jgi:hypothetical protein